MLLLKNTAQATRVQIIILVAIIIFGFVIRLWQIDAAPPGIYPDEAQNGYDAYVAQDTNNYKWFYPDNNGREGLYINLIAFSFKLLGVNMFSFKLASIFAGTLTILGIYLLTRELFWRSHNSVWLSLISAFLVASSFWHIMFSRIGFRAILLPLVLVFSFWLFLYALRILKYSKKYRLKLLIIFFISGFIFGIGLHTYIAFRIAPAILVVLVLSLLLTRQFRIRALITPALLFFIGAFISATPIFLTFYTHPEYLTSRSADISIFSQANNNGNIIKALSETVWLSFTKFNILGDQNWRHGYPPYPTLEPIVGIFFIIGFFSSVFTSLKFFTFSTLNIFNRYLQILNVRYSLHPSLHFFLLSWFVFMLAPEFLTVEGLPHSLRSIGALPVVYIFSVLGINIIWKYAEKNKYFFHRFFIPILIATFLYIGIFGAIKYHVYWANQPQVAQSFNKNLTDIAHAISLLPDSTDKIIVAGPLERLPIKLLNTKTKNMTVLYEHEISSLSIETIESDIIIFITDNREDIVKQFESQFGKLRVTKTTDTYFDTSYYTLTRITK